MTSPAPSESARVLIVDDEPDFVANLSDILSDFGFLVEGTSSPHEALDWTATRDYDAAVIDLRMPGLDGLGLNERMRGSQQDVPTILLTAYADPATQQAAREAGFWSILEKPCQIPVILSLLHTLTHAPTVLLVDDDPEYCHNLLQILHQRRIRATACSTIAAAIDRWNRRPTDIVLLDLKFPGESAVDLIRHVRRSQQVPDVRLITGVGPADDREWQEIHEWSVGSIWRKPLDVGELIASLLIGVQKGPISHGS